MFFMVLWFAFAQNQNKTEPGWSRYTSLLDCGWKFQQLQKQIWIQSVTTQTQARVLFLLLNPSQSFLMPWCPSLHHQLPLPVYKNPTFSEEKWWSCAVQKFLITLYTKEHTKSMKPHCILGSWSEQFLSIMGWGRQRRQFQITNILKRKTTNKKRGDGKAQGPYNWLLVQNRSLQISLFPEFSSNHQSHLVRNRQTDDKNDTGE